MSDPFIGQVKQFGFNWAPQDYALCNGGEIATNDNPALYSLIGNQFGGTGTTTFRLPDLRGRTPVHSWDYNQGTAYGVEAVTLTEDTMPAHTHSLSATSTTGTMPFVTTDNMVFANAIYYNRGPAYIYGPPVSLVKMNSATCSTVGGNQSHTNIQPSLAINFVIALQGVYPSRS